MELLGHSTPSMFRRYDIKDESDLRAGVRLLAQGVSGLLQDEKTAER